MSDTSTGTMRSIVKKRFLDDILGVVSEKSSGWIILVTDDNATRVISSVLMMYDIMEKRVTLVEKLDKVRQPYKDMDVVYIISPTQASTNLVVKDFQSEAKAKYNRVHLFYLDGVSDSVFSLLQSSPVLIERMDTLTEVNMDFLTIERNVFHCDVQDSLQKFYGQFTDRDHTTRLAKQLATVCITTGEFPSIRYQAASTFARDIATKLLEFLRAFRDSNPNHGFRGDPGNNKERGQLVIMDRATDIITPLLHEYTYQAMANDLLAIEDGIVSYNADMASKRGGRDKGDEKQALLNDSDELWAELRHSHIAHVIDVIKDRMNDIVENNAGAKLAKSSGKDMSITAMANAVKSLPEYKTIMSKLTQHVALAQQCMDSFSRQGLLQLSQLEQTISTGVDADGRKAKNSEIDQQIQEILDGPTATKLIKLRLFSLYVASGRGVGSTLVQGAGCTTQELAFLGSMDRLSNIMKAQMRMHKTIFGSFTKKNKNAEPDEGAYQQSRHIPYLRNVLEDLVSGELPTDSFPAIGPTQSAPTQQVIESKRTRKIVGTETNKQMNFKGGRVMVFVAGGISYTELRTCNEFEKEHKREMIIGGSHIINPKKFVQTVANLATASANLDFDQALVVSGNQKIRL